MRELQNTLSIQDTTLAYFEPSALNGHLRFLFGEQCFLGISGETMGGLNSCSLRSEPAHDDFLHRLPLADVRRTIDDKVVREQCRIRRCLTWRWLGGCATSSSTVLQRRGKLECRIESHGSGCRATFNGRFSL